MHSLTRTAFESLGKLGIAFILLTAYCDLVRAQVPGVNAFYQNIVNRREAIADICSMGNQWNSATGGSYYSYLNKRIQEAWQRGDGAMVNRYKAEGLVAQRYCRGIF